MTRVQCKVMAVEFVVSHHVQGRNQPSQGMKILGHFFGFPAMSPAKSSVGFVGSLTPPPYFIACRMGNAQYYDYYSIGRPTRILRDTIPNESPR